VNIYKIYTA